MSSEATYLTKADFTRKFEEVDGTTMAVKVSGFQVICSYIGLNVFFYLKGNVAYRIILLFTT